MAAKFANGNGKIKDHNVGEKLKDCKRKAAILILLVLVSFYLSLACGPVNDLVQKRIRETQAAWTAVPTIAPCICELSHANEDMQEDSTGDPTDTACLANAPYPTYTHYPTNTPYPTYTPQVVIKTPALYP